MCIIIVVHKGKFFYNTGTNFAHALGSFLFIPIESPSGKFAPILGVGWTLNIEMYFYLLLSLIMFLYGERYLNYLTITVISLVIFGEVVTQLDNHTYLSTVFTTPMLLEFVLGMFVF